MPVIPALRRLRQEDCKFDVSLDYIVRPVIFLIYIFILIYNICLYVNIIYYINICYIYFISYIYKIEFIGITELPNGFMILKKKREPTIQFYLE
jgi:hypothetical protein